MGKVEELTHVNSIKNSLKSGKISQKLNKTFFLN